MLPSTREFIIEELKKLQVNHDVESAHIKADEALCKLLILLDYRDVVEEYEKVPKWYA